MGRKKGRHYTSYSCSLKPEQLNRLENEIPNISALIRGLLDVYFERWHPLMHEYRQIIESITSTTTWRTETEILELAAKIEDDPKYAERFYEPFVDQLKRIMELRQQIPKELL